MPWTQVLANWPLLLDHLSADFKHLERSALQRFRGDRARLETYLAETHDLTHGEAAEVLQDWLIFKAPHLEGARAA